MNIQVLWVDDEYKADFVSFAEQEGIDIHYQKSAVEGKAELLRNCSHYHAVILDAKGILNPEDKTTDLKGLALLRDHLMANSASHYLPFFIFTGQPGYQTNEDFRDSYGNFYTKGKDEEHLMAAIKDAVQKKEEYIIHQKYSKVFQSVKTLLDSDTHHFLTDLLLRIQRQDHNFDETLYYTRIRIILESLFRLANKCGLLHDKCIKDGKVNLSESSLFLSGANTKYAGVKNSQPHFPKLISSAVKDIVFTTGAASHTPDPDANKDINLTDYSSQIDTPYLLYRLCFQLLDIIIWFDQYLKTNPDDVQNRKQWQQIAATRAAITLKGVVTRIAENSYGTFTPENGQDAISIIPKMVKAYHLKLGQQIIAEVEAYGSKNLIKEIIISKHH